MPHRLASILSHLRRVIVRQTDGGLSDAQLLERFTRQRDEAAFEVLVWRHGPMVLGVGRRVLRNLADAEDVVQATFLVLVRQARSIKRREALGAWLHKVAYRIALRARQRRRNLTTEPLGSTPEPAVPAAKAEPEALALLDDELQQLPAKYRTPLVLSYLQGLTNREIAAELGCPIGTVFTRLARGREMLRTRLVRRGVTMSGGVLAAILTQAAQAATLSGELVRTTVQTALAFVAGSAAAVAPHVAALTEGVLKMMWISKLKLVAAALVLAIAAGSGAGLLAFRATAIEADDGKKLAVADDKPAAEARRPAREALRYGGKSFEEWRNVLLTELKPESRAEAIKALSAFGAKGYAREAVPIILDAIRDYYMAAALGDDQKVVDAGHDGLLKIGAEAVVPVLIEEINKGKRNGRLFAVTCLASFPPADAKPAISATIDAIKDEDVQIRIRAIRTLLSIDSGAASTRAIAASLSDQNPGVRELALAALEEFGPKAKEAIPQLLAASRKDEFNEFRKRALRTLKKIGPSNQEFLPTLREALKDADIEVRVEAIDSLAGMGAEGKTAVPDLIAALKKTTNPGELQRIAQALGNMGPSAKAAIPALTEALRKGQESSFIKNSSVQGYSNPITMALEKISK